MNSNWQIHKIGLIDFWYYDEEEFFFEQGRMLLRGANGTGKSVTMQSFIPLLLDGNMRPERLDPFGSRARRMENYLLEDNDDRDERTGYLYMEFKRENSSTYVTIGIGMRARRGKPLDTWYFFLQDGRRVGKDFYLYRQERERVALTKQELRNRIGEGGQVFESQKEYMSRVNSLIFGFETDDAYKELIDLLIQLRTPKLSKEFKPSIINDILTNSLMPLSEDDLRPMSEAIENMDGLKASLDGLRMTFASAKKISRVYDKYNRFYLFDKSRRFKKYSSEMKNEEKYLKGIEKELKEKEENLAKERSRRNDLATELELRSKELESYKESDTVKLIEEKEQLAQDSRDKENELKSREKLYEEKKELRTDTEYRKKDSESKTEALNSEIDNTLNEMSDTLSVLTFDEHEFMKNDLTENRNEKYSFGVHNDLLEKKKEQIERGIDKLKEEELLKNRYAVQLESVEELSARRDKKEREQNLQEDQLRIIRNELLETVNLWNRNSTEISVSDTAMQEMSTLIENYDSEGNYEDIQRPAAKVYYEKQDELRLEKTRIRNILEIKDQEIHNKEKEIQEWKDREEPAPPRSHEVTLNREKLDDANIDYTEFYRVIDFPDGMEEQKKNRIEEALLAMGVLDALIVSREDFHRIRSIDSGLCDRYILTDMDNVKDSLSEFMEIDTDSDEMDMLIHSRISKALSGISYGNDGGGHTGIYEDGHYRIGAVTGTITDNYSGKFIGYSSRQRYKEKMIDDLNMEVDELRIQRKEIEESLARMENRLTTLDSEWSEFPEGTDLKIIVQDIANTAIELDRIWNNLKEEQEVLNQLQRELNELHLLVRQICDKVYLPPEKETFLRAKEEETGYSKLLHSLELMHSRYLDGFALVNELINQLDIIDSDIDQLLSDIRDIKNSQRKIDERIESVSEQLKLTNASEIEEKIQFATRRIREIPQEQEDCITALARLENAIETATREKEYKTTHLTELGNRCHQLEEAVLDEAELKYYSDEVNDMIRDGASAEKIAEYVIRMENSTLSGLESNGITGELQESFYENRAMLAEYNPVMNVLFESGDVDENPDFHFRRLDIQTRYRGVSMSFSEFLKRINLDIEEKSGLLDDKERELFEDILLGVINRKIRAKIYNSESWVDDMNKLMGDMRTSSGIRLSLKWKSRHAEHEEQMDTRKLVELLKKDQKWMKEEESEQLLNHFRSKIQEARKTLEQESSSQSFHTIVRDILDYRQWFEFRLEYEKLGEKKKELTDRDFFTFSGGEKAMSMYVPLFSAVVAKYGAARGDAPRLISLDEAFAGVDARNINDMFRLMVDFRFSFIINSQILWGDYETVPKLAIYQLIRSDNVKFVTVVRYTWNGKVRMLGDGSHG